MLFAATNGHSGSSSRPKYELLDNFLPNTEKVSFTQFIDDEGPNNGQQLKVDNVTSNTLKTSNIIPIDSNAALSSRYEHNQDKSMEPSQKKARKR